MHFFREHSDRISVFETKKCVVFRFDAVGVEIRFY